MRTLGNYYFLKEVKRLVVVVSYYTEIYKDNCEGYEKINLTFTTLDTYGEFVDITIIRPKDEFKQSLMSLEDAQEKFTEYFI